MPSRRSTADALARLERLVDGLIGSGVASAAVALVGDPHRVVWRRAVGQARGGPAADGKVSAERPADAGTWFDYGSITKPFVATLALALDRTGELPLGAPVGTVLPGAEPRLAGLPLSDLLLHRAGLAAWTPLYARCRSLADVEALLLSGALLGASAGTYSDLDVLLWGLAAARSLGRGLAELVAERVLAPLGLAAEVAAVPGDLPRVAASYMDTAREVALAAAAGLAAPLLPPPPPGWPQDGNARFLAELAATTFLPGHAGLFGTADALWRLGAEWLRPGVLLHNAAVDAALAGGGRFALGWWRRRARGGGGGPGLHAGSYGHTGFAGGSLWIDPRAGLVFVLLAHRRDPASDMNRWRRRFHAAAARAFVGRDRTESH